MAQQTIKWLDLSEYKAQISVMEMASGKEGAAVQKVVVLTALPGASSDDMDKMAEALGFKKRGEGKKAFYYLPGETSVKLKKMYDALKGAGFNKVGPKQVLPSEVFKKLSSRENKAVKTPGAKVKKAKPEVSPEEIQRKKNAAKAKNLKKEVSSDVLFDLIKNTRRITGDDDVKTIREDKNGVRYVVDMGNAMVRGSIISEADAAAKELPSEYFFRVTDDNSLKSCANFVASMLLDGVLIKYSGFQKLVEDCFGQATPENIDLFNKAIESSLHTQLRLSGEKSQSKLFTMATRAVQSAAYRKDVVEGSETPEINLALATVINRLTSSIVTDVKSALTLNVGSTAITSGAASLKDVEVSAFETDTSAHRAINIFSRDAGFRNTTLSGDVPAMETEKKDLIVANLPSGWASTSATIGGEEFHRSEFAEAINILQNSRTDNGTSVFSFLLPDADSEDKDDYKRFMEAIGREYAIEGAAKIASAAHNGSIGGNELFVVSVGVKRDEALTQAPEAALRVQDINSVGQLYTWSSEVVKAKAKISNLEVSVEVGKKVGDDLEENDYQTPYVPASKSGEASAMAPSYLAEPMAFALERLVKAHPDVDAYVANQLGMTKARLSEVLSPEQIDAVALEAFAQEEGKTGFHDGDETGMGKGRVMAAIAHRYVLSGYTPVTLTGKSANITDQIRDFGDIGVLSQLNPLILNGGTYTYQDPSTGEVFTYEGLNKERVFEELVEVEDPFLRDEDGNMMYSDGQVLVKEKYLQRKASKNGDGAFITNSKGHFVLDSKIVRHISSNKTDENGKLLRGEVDLVYPWEEETPGTPKFDAAGNRIPKESFAERDQFGVALRDDAGNLIPRKDLFIEDARGNMVPTEELLPEIIGEFTVKIPNEYNVIMGTYSQVSGNIDDLNQTEPHSMKAAKLRFFREFMDDSCVLMPDEAQKATGNGNTGKNLRHALENSSRPVFASATHASTIKEIELYNLLFPKYMNSEEVYEILKNGGETAQEVISSMLARNGTYIRREKDESKKEFIVVEDAEHIERNKEVQDSLAPILQEMMIISGSLRRRLNKRAEQMDIAISTVEANIDRFRDGLKILKMMGDDPQAKEETDVLKDRIKEESNKKERQKNRAKRLTSSRFAFGTPKDRITKSLEAAVQADFAAEMIINGIKAGKRPTVFLDSTFGPLYKEMYELQELEGRETSPKPMLSDFVRREIQKMFNGFEEAFPEPEREDYSSEEEYLQAMDQYHSDEEYRLEALQTYGRMMSMLDQIVDIPLSCWDEIREKVEAAGFTVGEMSGRSYYYDGEKFCTRKKPRTEDVVADFNAGRAHCALLNKSATEGISMHDAPWFPELGHGERFMLLIDPSRNIKETKQGLGRISRFGNQSDAFYYRIVSGLPSQTKTFAVFNMKSRRLSANSTSNRDSSDLIDGIPDLFNSVGDEVVTRYFERNPQILQALGLEEDFFLENEENNLANEDGEIEENSFSANYLINQISVLDCAMQEKIYRDLTIEFEQRIDELNEANANPLVPVTIPGQGEVVSSMIVDGSANEYVADAFESPCRLEDVIFTADRKPISSEEVEIIVANASRATNLSQQEALSQAITAELPLRLDRLFSRRRLGAEFDSLEEALGNPSSLVSVEKKYCETLETMIRELQPGTEIRLQNHMGEMVHGVVGRVSYPESLHAATFGERYRVQIFTPGSAFPLQTTFGGLMKNPGFDASEDLAFEGDWYIKPGLNSSNDTKVSRLLNSFDTASLLQEKKQARLLTGNLVKALEISQNSGGLGNIVLYYDKSTETYKRGLLVKSDKMSKLYIPVRLKTPEMAYDALAAHDNIVMTGDYLGTKKSLMITSKNGALSVTLPSPNNKDFGCIYDGSEALLEMYMTAYEASKTNPEQKKKMGPIKIEIGTREDMMDLLTELIENSGQKLFMSANYRDWSIAYTSEKDAALASMHEQAISDIGSTRVDPVMMT